MWACPARRGFNPRPRARGRPTGGDGHVAGLPVSIHAPARGGDAKTVMMSPAAEVSIHAPARGGDFQGGTHGRARTVSIHAPARGGDDAASGAHPPAAGFNPRPRARGRLLARAACPHHIAVSIHAPARGGDERAQYSPMLSKDVSIHAPARGGDSQVKKIDAMLVSFNPRPRARGRRGERVEITQVRFVSIHAPARGGDRHSTAKGI